MSLSLGEKLRQAREEKGISVGEVSEQTRISPLYIECIENDDYKPLPGGIFNKGFVKSYAKFIGLDEHEALQDYSRIVAQTEGASDEVRKYKPEVLTDDRAGGSLIPTVIFAGIILALMTGGVLFFVNYLQNQPDTPTANANRGNSNTDVNTSQTDANTAVSPTNAPPMETLKVEFRAAADPVSLSTVVDGKNNSVLVNNATPAMFEPKESLKLSYSKSLASSAQLSINGKQITLPEGPANPRRATIEFEINKDNLAKIWQSGAISFEEPATPGQTSTPAATTTPNVAATPVRPAATPTPARTPTPNRAATPAARPTTGATPAANVR